MPPTSASSDEEIEEFYEQLGDTLVAEGNLRDTFVM